MRQGWGKEPDPSSPIPSPQVLGCYFLTREPAIPVQPPSRPSALFSTATSKQQQAGHNLQASPAQPSQRFLQRQLPHVPIATSDQDVGCLVEAGRGAGKRSHAAPSNKHTLARCVPTFALPHTLLISRSLLHSLLVRGHHKQPARLHRSNQSSSVPVSRTFASDSSHSAPPAPAPSSCRRPRISPPWLVLLPLPVPRLRLELGLHCRARSTTIQDGQPTSSTLLGFQPFCEARCPEVFRGRHWKRSIER